MTERCEKCGRERGDLSCVAPGPDGSPYASMRWCFARWPGMGCNGVIVVEKACAILHARYEEGRRAGMREAIGVAKERAEPILGYAGSGDYLPGDVDWSDVDAEIARRLDNA